MRLPCFYLYDTDMIDEKTITEDIGERAVLVGLITPTQNEAKANEYLAELAFLAETAGAKSEKRFLQRVDNPNPRTFVGKGKLEEIRQYIEDNAIDLAIFDDDLTSKQVQNIENELKVKILDRTNLILDIFAKRAQTATARTQVELAQYQYLLPRLTRMWTHLERQRGGIGMRGPGEAQIETDRRIILDKISRLKVELKNIDRQKSIQRKNRGKLTRIALVGYTNVGKSSLMNALCGPSVAEADMLFATLDPTSRKLVLPSGMAVLLVDTVGFVSRLPHNLVEAFKSTLEEAAWSDVIIRVADAGDDQREEQLSVTDEVLDGLDCADIPRLTVYNKCDKPNTLSFDPDILLTSAKTGYGLDKLLQKLDEVLSDRVHTIRVLLPYDKLGLAAPMRERGSVQVEEYREDGLYLEGIVKTEDLHCFEGYLV